MTYKMVNKFVCNEIVNCSQTFNRNSVTVKKYKKKAQSENEKGNV